MPPVSGGASLVGRSEEVAFLRAAVATRGAVLGGEAGVGKTRVARAAVDGLADWYVSWATATPSSSALPLGGLDDWELPAVAEEGRSRAVYLSRLVAALLERAQGRRALLVVDDAHLLDDLSVALVHRLATTGAASVLVTVRTGERQPAGVVALSRDGLLPRLELQPLGRTEFGALVAGCVGAQPHADTVQRLWELSDGNVMYAVELLADAVDVGDFSVDGGRWRWRGSRTVGPRLTEVVAHRMGRLEGARRRLAEVLAVGEPVGLGIVEALVPGADLVAEEAQGLIAVDESGRRAVVRLGHPLFGEAVRARLPVLARRQLQRRLADAVEAAGAQRAGDALRVALWRLESASATDADLLLRAARLARASFDPALALRLARASHDLAPSFAAAHQTGAALAELGRYGDALDTLDPLVGSEPGPVSRRELAADRAWAAFQAPQGLGAARAILEQLEADADADLVDRMLARGHLATLAAYEGRFPEALALGLPLVEAGMDDRVRLRALPSVGASLAVAGRGDRVLALCDALAPAVATAVQDGLTRAVTWIVAARANALVMTGRLTEAVDLLGPLLRSAAGVSARPGDLAYARTKLALVELLRGRPGTALEDLTTAAATLRVNDPNRCLPWCVALTAQAQAMLGRRPEAQRCAEEAVRRAGEISPPYAGDARRALAWVRATGGERSRAVAELLAAADAEEASGEPAFAVLALHDAVRWGAGRAVVDRLERLAAGMDGPGPEAVAVHARAVRAADPEGLLAAAEAFAASGNVWVAGELAGQAGDAYAAAGHRASAAAAHRRAAAWVAPEVVAGPAGRAAGAAAALTRRETEVAELAAQGLPNTEIARRLVLSVRTVESHLYAAYAKLGVTGRSALTAVLAGGSAQVQ